MDGHPQATVVLFPCSLVTSQGFKEATMRIARGARTLAHLLVFLIVICFSHVSSCYGA
jgi:hypothetical protein